MLKEADSPAADVGNELFLSLSARGVPDHSKELAQQLRGRGLDGIASLDKRMWPAMTDSQLWFSDLIGRLETLSIYVRVAKDLLQAGDAREEGKSKKQHANRWLIGRLAAVYYELTGEIPTAYRQRDRDTEPIDTPFVRFVLGFVTVVRFLAPDATITATFIADNLAAIRKEHGIPSP